MLIEHQLGGTREIDAADDGGERRLVTGGLLHLRHQVAMVDCPR